MSKMTDIRERLSAELAKKERLVEVDVWDGDYYDCIRDLIKRIDALLDRKEKTNARLTEDAGQDSASHAPGGCSGRGVPGV